MTGMDWGSETECVMIPPITIEFLGVVEHDTIDRKHGTYFISIT
jgi:hypothetical protein